MTCSNHQAFISKISNPGPLGLASSGNVEREIAGEYEQIVVGFRRAFSRKERGPSRMMMKTSKGYFRRNTQKGVQFNCLFVASFRRALKGDGSP